MIDYGSQQRREMVASPHVKGIARSAYDPGHSTGMRAFSLFAVLAMILTLVAPIRPIVAEAATLPFKLYLPFPADASVRASGPHAMDGGTISTSNVASSVDFGGTALPVTAAHAGRVTILDRWQGRPCWLSITDVASRWETRYMHLTNVPSNLTNGVEVAVGTRLGDMGQGANPRGGVNTCGRSDPGFPHVHFSLWWNDKAMPIDATSIGGYTVYKTGSNRIGYCGKWVRDASPAAESFADSTSRCQAVDSLRNDQAYYPGANATPDVAPWAAAFKASSTPLGRPIGAVQRIGAGCVQEFKGGTKGAAALMQAGCAGTVLPVTGAHWTRVKAVGPPLIGYPKNVSHRYWATWTQDFVGGTWGATLLMNPDVLNSQAFAVHGVIRTIYLRSPGPSAYGVPKAAEVLSSGGTVITQDFTGRRIQSLDAKALEGRIIRRNDGVSWVVVDNTRRHIPTAASYLCARYVENRGVALTGLNAELASTIAESTLKHSCTLPNSILRAMDKPDPKPSWAFYAGTRHWIPDPWTYHYLAGHGYRILDIRSEAEILALPGGVVEPGKLDPVAIPINTIIRRADGVSYVVGPDRGIHHVPYAQDDVCWRNLKGLKVSATGLTTAQVNAFREYDRWPCTIGDRIVKSSDGSSYLVDKANYRHWIPDAETLTVLARTYPQVGPWSATDVNLLPRGSDRPYLLDTPSIVNSIICRSDGVCWAVDGNAVRHHIPNYPDNVCWRWVNGWRVTRGSLSYGSANSLAEGNAWGCNLGGRIIATNEGASYYMDANTRRWIPDTESFYCYADKGSPVIRGMGMAEASRIPEGGWMRRCLSPNRAKNKIVRVSDGTAYFVDINGWWHWIPNGTVWGCLTSRYPILISNATWEQANSIRRENGVRATCSM